MEHADCGNFGFDSGAGPCYHAATGEGGRGFCVFLHHTTEQDHFGPSVHAPTRLRRCCVDVQEGLFVFGGRACHTGQS